MKALILAGGAGTRLRPLTLNLPKPMVPVLNRPLLEHTLLLLKKHHIHEVIFLLHYLPKIIQGHFGDGSELGIRIEHIVAEENYATAGAVKLAAQLIDDTFLVIAGDVVTDVNISSLIEFHQRKHRLATIALSNVQNPGPFGIAETDDNGQITKFLEKPTATQIFSHSVNMGIYVLEPAILDWIPANQPYYFAKDLFPKLAHTRELFYGFVDQCYWIDVGHLVSYRQLHRDFLQNRIDLTTKEDLKKTGVWQGKNCRVGRDVTIETSVLGSDAVIGDGVFLTNCVIGEKCKVGNNSSLIDCILWDGAEVGETCQLVSAVVSSRTKIADNTLVDKEIL
ncbi:MAG: sugar phosphate nucleotidyltransferase [bacterium]